MILFDLFQRLEQNPYKIKRRKLGFILKILNQQTKLCDFKYNFQQVFSYCPYCTARALYVVGLLKVLGLLCSLLYLDCSMQLHSLQMPQKQDQKIRKHWWWLLCCWMTGIYVCSCHNSSSKLATQYLCNSYTFLQLHHYTLVKNA